MSNNVLCIHRPHSGLYSYHLGVTSINQDVDQDVLSEFQRSPFFKGMATSRLTLLLPSVTQEEAGFILYIHTKTTQFTASGQHAPRAAD